jgi:oxalate decarboxylase
MFSQWMIHHIENIGNEEVTILVFFDQPIPGDIGCIGSLPADSREVLAASLQSSASQLPNVPFYRKDLLIVKRSNPVEP